MEFLKQQDSRFPRTVSKLSDKKILFCGDSICAASVYDYPDCIRWGWAGRISAASGCSYINLGRDGASLSDCRGENRILTQINAAKEENFDLVVLHGGVNDAWDSCPVGKISDSFDPKDFDITTCAGGLEELLYTVKQEYPNSKICFIANFPTPSSQIGSLSDMEAYFTEILKGCRKWGISVLDLYHDKEFSEKFAVKEKINTADYVHPIGCGYDLLYPVVMAFLEEQF